MRFIKLTTPLKKNLLKKKPSLKLVNKFLNIFNLVDIDDITLINRCILKDPLFKIKFYMIRDEIISVVSNHRKKSMLLNNNFSESKIITLLKYFLHYHNRFLCKCETTIKGKKVIYYRIMKLDKNNNILNEPIRMNTNKICITSNYTVVFQ